MCKKLRKPAWVVSFHFRDIFSVSTIWCFLVMSRRKGRRMTSGCVRWCYAKHRPKVCKDLFVCWLHFHMIERFIFARPPWPSSSAYICTYHKKIEYKLIHLIFTNVCLLPYFQWEKAKKHIDSGWSQCILIYRVGQK